LEFKRAGYLPEAVINYLAQLSWLPADTGTIFSLAELVEQFSLGKVSKSSPVFDYDKLKFINSRAIQQKSAADLCRLLHEDAAFHEQYAGVPENRRLALIELVKPRIKTLTEFIEKFRLYLNTGTDPGYDNEELQKLTRDYPAVTSARYLRLILGDLQNLAGEDFSAAVTEKVLRDCAEANGIKAADLIHPCRFALTYETVSPSLFAVFEFMGKAESLRRIERCAVFMEHLEG